MKSKKFFLRRKTVNGIDYYTKVYDKPLWNWLTDWIFKK